MFQHIDLSPFRGKVGRSVPAEKEALLILSELLGKPVEELDVEVQEEEPAKETKPAAKPKKPRKPAAQSA
jgi:hypothetical protein